MFTTKLLFVYFELIDNSAKQDCPPGMAPLSQNADSSDLEQLEAFCQNLIGTTKMLMKSRDIGFVWICRHQKQAAKMQQELTDESNAGMELKQEQGWNGMELQGKQVLFNHLLILPQRGEAYG